jgi:hypothetical protein
LEVLIDNAQKWAEQGWGGYVLPGIFQGTIATFAAITPKLTLEEAKVSMQPLVDFAQSLTNLTITLQVDITTLPNGYHDFLQTPDADTVGGFTGFDYSLSSRLVPKAANSAAKATLHEALMELTTNGKPNPLVPFYILMVPPVARVLPKSDLPGGPGYSSLSPAW